MVVPILLPALVACTPPPLLAPRDASTALGGVVERHELGEPLAAIEAQLRRAADRVPRERVLPCVRDLFERPWSLPEVAESMAAAAGSPRPGLGAARVTALALGTEPPSPEGHGTITVPSAMHAMFLLDGLARGGDIMVRQALAPLWHDATAPEPVTEEEVRAQLEAEAARRAAIRADALRLLEIGERTPMPKDDDAECATRLEAAARGIDFAEIARAIALADGVLDITCDWSAEPAEALPEELAGEVVGTILMAQSIEPLGWFVIGGPGPNRYDMGRIAAVFDPAGDDRYEWPGDVDGTRVIVDLAGDDHYRSEGPVGPGGALLGFACLRDRAGNDRYEGVTLSSGAAMLGAAVLIDEAGDDVHRARAWSQGAALFGAAALVDESGADSYEGRVLCQGVGGPRAVGALFDRGGDDRYRTRGAPSAYDTPATDRGFSQGVGYGIRRDLPGGVGVLVDGAGDDRYESGEFSQGGAYFFALGVLADRGGDDLYHGDRYAQGFAAHQAFGALLETAGDDVYYSRTAAGQGAAWDESAAVLVDSGGNDRYRADGLSQGAAAQQALAALVDLGGADSFDARGGAVQGAGGGAEYHFEQCDCYSLGVLLKLGTKAPRLNGRMVGTDMEIEGGAVGGSLPRDGVGETIVSSEITPDDPRASKAYGVRIIRLTPAHWNAR